MKKPSTLLLLLTTLLLCSCDRGKRAEADAADIQVDLTAAFDDLFLALQAEPEDRKINMAFGECEVTGEGYHTSELVHVIRAETVSARKGLDAFTEMTEPIKGFADRLRANGFQVEPSSRTTDEVPEPQYFSARIEKSSFEGFVFLSVGPPLEGYLSISAVAHLNKKR